MNLFNNREIAITIWLFAIFIFMLVKREIRESLLNVIKAFFKIKILFSIFLMIAYTTRLLIVLHLVRLWNTSLLKDSVIWFCFTGILMCFNLVTSKKKRTFSEKLLLII